VWSRIRLGECLMSLGRPADAKPNLQAAYDLGRKADAKPPGGKVKAMSKAHLAEAIDLLARVYEATGENDAAAAWRVERAKYPPEQASAPRPAK